ncbi:hypothetical protein QFZ96_006573 [Paraburkholderia youngii]
MAVSVARLTDARATPGTFASAFSTRNAQAAQVMPPISSSVVGGVSAGVAASVAIVCSATSALATGVASYPALRTASASC